MLLNRGECICMFALTELSYPALLETLICIVIKFISIQKSIVNNIGSRIYSSVTVPLGNLKKLPLKKEN